MPETELGGPPVIEVPDSESISKDEEYRQNAKRCQTHAEHLDGMGAVTLAGLYRDMARHWRWLAEQAEQSRF